MLLVTLVILVIHHAAPVKVVPWLPSALLVRIRSLKAKSIRRSVASWLARFKDTTTMENAATAIPPATRVTEPHRTIV